VAREAATGNVAWEAASCRSFWERLQGAGGAATGNAAFSAAAFRIGTEKRPPWLVGATPESSGAVSRATALLPGIRIAAYLPPGAILRGSSPLLSVYGSTFLDVFTFLFYHLTHFPFFLFIPPSLCIGRVPPLFSLFLFWFFFFYSPGLNCSFTPPRPHTLMLRFFTDSLFLFFPVSDVSISSGNESPSATNHERCFRPSVNYGRASVSRKRDAGQNSPSGRRGRFSPSRAPSRPAVPSRRGQLASLHPPLPRRRNSRGADVTRGAHWALPQCVMV
jgi:hypothetical protein